MKLYLMQHGKAMSKEENPDRPLHEEGKQDVTAMSEFLACAGVHVEQIRHSGKTRAEETAAIVGDRLQTQVISVTGIGPTDNIRPIAEALKTEMHAVMYVGHLPFLSQLASYLLCGDAAQELVQFQKGGVVCLQYEDGAWSVNWMVVPELVKS